MQASAHPVNNILLRRVLIQVPVLPVVWYWVRALAAIYYGASGTLGCPEMKVMHYGRLSAAP